jgi:succinate-acetate transporter protein
MIKATSHFILSVSVLGLAYVCALAWWNPQHVMALANVDLTNTDAISSIRGIYGGAGTFVVSIIIYFWRKKISLALTVLGAFWLLYAFARVVTWAVDGPMGDFGNQWLIIEFVLGSTALALSVMQRNH